MYVALNGFNPSESIDLWCKDKMRRPNQNVRKKYKRHKQVNGLSSKNKAVVVKSNYITFLKVT